MFLGLLGLILLPVLLLALIAALVFAWAVSPWGAAAVVFLAVLDVVCRAPARR
jgi:hypothetical protein